MSFKRTHFLMIGLVMLFIGVQFRLVEGFVLNKPTSQFVSEKFGSKPKGIAAVFTQSGPTSIRTLEPPKWLAWTFISIGAVLGVYSFALPKTE